MRLPALLQTNLLQLLQPAYHQLDAGFSLGTPQGHLLGLPGQFPVFLLDKRECLVQGELDKESQPNADQDHFVIRDPRLGVEITAQVDFCF